MAVSEMTKVTVIAHRTQKDELLREIQVLQNLEIMDGLENLRENEQEILNQLSHDFEGADDLVNVTEEEKQLTETRKLLLFLEDHNVKPIKPVYHEKQTLDEFEKMLSKVQVTTMKAKVAQLRNEELVLKDERERLLTDETFLTHWQGLKHHPRELSRMRYTRFLMGSFSTSVKGPMLKALETLDKVVYEIAFETEKTVYLSFIFSKEVTEALEAQLSYYSFQKKEYPYAELPVKELKMVKQQLSKNQKLSDQLLKRIQDLREESLHLKYYEEYLLAKIERERVVFKVKKYRQFLVFRGWIEKDRQAYFEQKIAQLSVDDQPISIAFSEPEQADDVPTKLKNNKLIAPFESLTEMYSLPKYGELDPTPYLMPFYMVFFGMMVADLGYGLLMLIGTIVAGKVLMLRKSTKKFLDFFKILSIPVMIWGLIYGSFFGIALPFHLLSTSEDMNTILLLSVVFGFIQMLVGLLINGVQLVKKKQVLKSISNGFAWQGVLIAGALMAVSKLVWQNELLFKIAIGLLILSAVMIVIVPMIESQSKGKGLASGLYDFYGITGYVGDLVSYTRLMALGISGGSIAAAFNMLVGFMPPLARYSIGIVLIIALQALNIFLSLLSAYVHSARLQYVEYFGKFFEGGGRAFTPLKPKEKYIDFEIRDKE
ncbi:V-type ATP synthase subunit I [Vagococcus sp.]|uniref:V-type ATP synthase subunit I n=1 Tax=Vagococcus sp. TaxID=1933889 RepID=UPI003F9AFFE8